MERTASEPRLATPVCARVIMLTDWGIHPDGDRFVMVADEGLTELSPVAGLHSISQSMQTSPQRVSMITDGT